MRRAGRLTGVRRGGLLAGVGVLVLHAAATALPLFPTGGVSGPRPHRSALIVFVSYHGNELPLVGATQMRLSAGGILSAALETEGHEIIGYPELDPLLQEWRIRSDRDVTPEFLDALRSGFDVSRLLVVKMAVYRDRLIVLTRGMRVDSGLLVSADVSDRPLIGLWDNPVDARTRWDLLVARSARQFAKRWRGRLPAGESGTLVVLPVNPVGVGTIQSDVAAHCLLRSLLDRGHWSLPDPSLVLTALSQAGHRHRPLTARARETLTTRFGAETLVVPSIVSFRDSPSGNRPPPIEEDFDWEPSYLLETRAPLYMALRIVDSATGDIVSGTAQYLKPESPEGLFGTSKESRVAGRLQAGTNRLVKALPGKGTGK